MSLNLSHESSNVIGIEKSPPLHICSSRHPSFSLSLPSKSGNRNLFSDLLKLNTAINSDEFDLERIKPLLDAVLRREPDELIWDRVYDAIAEPAIITPVSGPKTPLRSTTSATPSFQQTPWSFNSGSGVQSFKPRDDMDPILRAEVENNLVTDHPRLLDTLFGQVAELPEIASIVFEMCKDANPRMYSEGIGWADWLPNCKEDEVLGFLRRHIDLFLLFASDRGFRPLKRQRCVTAPN
ncbi:hypothetical protein MPH_13815 [Macrophomina phaseolina MS6]|uniref:Uncharacterized protein n=1 Tax=Macrophomina phaseolina (strain MS6) TaxID=1126212 RepID=K2R8F6_MACPH|nr:hypothetical protein MPH_13815 [Macrophomina phaseolina MS6]